MDEVREIDQMEEFLHKSIQSSLCSGNEELNEIELIQNKLEESIQ